MREATKKTEKRNQSRPRAKRSTRRPVTPMPTLEIINKGMRDSIRQAFFAEAGAAAAKYGVTLEQVFAHLEVADEFMRLEATSNRNHRVNKIPGLINDLVLATACTHGIGLAWQDLREQHTHLLNRAAEMRLDEIDAILHVRRFWDEMEEQSRGNTNHAGPRMQDYPGTRPLRIWLADRVLGGLEKLARGGEIPTNPQRPLNIQSRTPLRLVD